MRWYLIPYYFIIEYLLILRNRFYSYAHPYPPEQWSNGESGDILLIQGLHERWTHLRTIGNTLNNIGFRIHIVNDLENNTKPVQKGYQHTVQYITKHKLNKFIIISHSKGGIIAMYILKNTLISPKVLKLITIACPYQGTIFARLMPSARELHGSSAIINKATEGIDLNKIINIYPRIDNHIAPNSSLKFEGIQNKQINIFGHTRILESKQTISEILKSLNSLKLSSP